MKNKNKLMIVLTIIILLLLFVVVYLLFFRDSTYTITFDSNGGTEIEDVEVENGEIVKLPEPPKKDGYKFVGWTNKKGQVVTKGTQVKDDLTLKAEWIKNDVKQLTVQFDTDGGNEIENILIEDGKVILLPIPPVKEGYTFIGWINQDGYFIDEGMNVTSNIILKALWVKEGAETVKIKFNTDGGSEVKGFIFEKGLGIILPSNPKKEGYVFGGWIDENGNSIAKGSIINENITLRAVWKSYTCPSGCTPIGDGSKCTKEVTTKMTTKTGCPSGSILYNTWYGSGSFCIKLSTKVDANIRQCDTWEAAEVEYRDGNGKHWCVKTVKKVTTKGCPSGYKQSGDICKKTETVNCTLN